ncbi:MAG: type II secretion system minor pseudopilin GspK [Caldimonas sp.]
MSRQATRRSSTLPGSQRGAALLTAMIIVTLVATLAASMIWQQWRAVQVEGAERAREQSAWILAGALDWARLILKEDARNNARSGSVDHLGEPWAVPLAEARLSTFLDADKASNDDGPEAFLSGQITDAQSRYNLVNLVSGGKIDATQVEALSRLCEASGADPEAAAKIAAGLLLAQGGSATSAPESSSGAMPLMPRTVGQLSWLGIDAETLRMLRPYVVLLPRQTAVNVNTAPREVLVAAIAGLDLASAERIIQRRPFDSLAKVEKELPALGKLDATKLAVWSSFFEVRGRIRLEDRVLEQLSLVERRGFEVVVLRRERIASRDQPAS